MKNLFTQLSEIFTNKIWRLDTSKMSTAKRRVVRFVKLVRITVDTFMQNRMGFQCVALSYFVALAIVPLAAFIFAVTNGLNLSDKLDQFIVNISPANLDLTSVIREKALNIIDTAQSGAVGLVSALTFGFTIIWLMFQVERVFNNVWGLSKVPRKIYMRFSFYLLILLLTPFLLIIFGAGIAYYSDVATLIGFDLGDKMLPDVLMGIGLYVVTVFTFSAMYKFIPATKVQYKWALRSAVFSGLVFVLFQYIYLETQTFVTRMNAVYGAIAAIPLLLIWMNFNWQIIIYGAELCYGYHHVDTYNIPEWKEE